MADSFFSNSKHVFLIGKNLLLMLGQTIFFMTWLSWTLKSYRGTAVTKKYRLKTLRAIGQNQTSANMKRAYRVRTSIPRHFWPKITFEIIVLVFQHWAQYQACSSNMRSQLKMSAFMVKQEILIVRDAFWS